MQEGGGRILCSGRGSGHPGRVPDAVVKEWKNERGKRYGMDTGYYSSSRAPSGRNSRTRMRSGVQSQ